MYILFVIMYSLIYICIEFRKLNGFKDNNETDISQERRGKGSQEIVRLQ